MAAIGMAAGTLSGWKSKPSDNSAESDNTEIGNARNQKI
jgi:hypothetical protein